MKKLIIFFILITNLTAFAQPFNLNNEIILKAMKDEMKRSMDNLKLDNLEKPYYIAYTLQIKNPSSISAILGSVIDTSSLKYATLTVDLRVGNYKLDNSNFFDVGLGFFGSTDDEEIFKRRRIPYEMSYNSLRRELWLATDAAYKQNSEIYSKKISVMQNRVIKDTTHDFSKIEPQKNYILKTIPTFEMSNFMNIAAKLSGIFKSYSEIRSSSVNIEYLPEITFYVNSEGMEYINVDYYTGVEVSAFTQAEDGMPLSDFYTAFSLNPANLPSYDSMYNAVDLIAKNLNQQRKSETLDEPYSGPVIFSGQAAGEIISQIFAPQLVAIREPMTEGGFSSNNRSGLFQNKIGARVLPEFLTLKVVPTLDKYSKTELLGAYDIDDDGLKTHDFDIVENGFLKTLLSDRIPKRRVKQSNASKRGGAAMYGNLQLIGDKEKSFDLRKLVDKMAQLCKNRELPYGILITKIINQNVMFTTLYRTSFGLLSIPQGDNKLAIAEAYKVYPNGKKELIRGAEILNISPQLFKDIIAIGSTNYAHNLLAATVVSSFISGGDQYVGSSIITPDLLFEDIEIKSIEGSFQKPPKLTNPLSSR